NWYGHGNWCHCKEAVQIQEWLHKAPAEHEHDGSFHGVCRDWINWSRDSRRVHPRKVHHLPGSTADRCFYRCCSDSGGSAPDFVADHVFWSYRNVQEECPCEKDGFPRIAG